jgi:hypothetical protein
MAKFDLSKIPGNEKEKADGLVDRIGPNSLIT